MKIGLIGYGKMGKAIERIALERGHTISYKIDSKNTIDQVQLNQADVAIEFTQPSLVINHIEQCISQGTPVVIGTTAWQEQLGHVSKLVAENNGALLHASNFSVGVNILFNINEKLAALMSTHPDYKAQIEEIHHIQKLDAPSGTAVSLAQGIIENNENYSSWKAETGSWPTVNTGELPIQAIREPEVPGTHTISYTSTIDTLTLSHEAHSRDGFALGSVIAAEFLLGKKGVFTMRDVLAF
ncbi:4-hydroxy-tetrahydrodipicolinate reductase [Fluviicola taffensis]|uniref:4-hydroxy-tetrahydrodipicolinate reductase n=1 Tax=Fluviicola taffensis (strain DSM 16823 / NCIMB 13979 / RW262) TaxID=755732 RepID=F2IDY0_FLUTR|nr:4-hydroxy-tetrahydrodipicolinate reductase [Fluviicola taffensis]AEA45544.1 dihydrodipicolinate reductase [Fluviicola taffensis DSM 16823]